MRILIYIACFNAERQIRELLKRIPAEYRKGPDVRVVVSDDCSSDDTSQAASQACKELGYMNCEVLRTKARQGDGGNQKIGCHYACHHGFDYVILLRGDGQDSPEELGHFFQSFKIGPDVVLAWKVPAERESSTNPAPFIKSMSNAVSTKIYNFLSQTKYAKFRAGYKAYATKFLREIPFELNSDDMYFDRDILFQAAFLEKTIQEFRMTTCCEELISSTKLATYGIEVIKTALKFKLQKMGIGCSLKFRGSKHSIYQGKFGYAFSTHYYLLKLIKKYQPKRILEVGCGAGHLGEVLKNENIWLVGIDLTPCQNECYNEIFCENIERFDWGKVSGERFDMVCLMDILEHLKEPEKLLLNLKSHPKFENALFVISVPNVAFFSIICGLLVGSFHYADRGILDISHKRFFTTRSFHATLKECGFEVDATIPIPPPFQLVRKGFVSSAFTAMFNALNMILPGLFAFQIIKVAKPVPVSTTVVYSFLRK